MAKKKQQKITKTPVTQEVTTIDNITTEKRQSMFIAEFFKDGNNISSTCQKIGIDRNAYYGWLKDPDFKKKIHDELEKLKDYAESMVIKAMPDDWRIHAKDRWI
jgi:transposase-like protein